MPEMQRELPKDHQWGYYDITFSEELFQRQLELNPNYPILEDANGQMILPGVYTISGEKLRNFRIVLYNHDLNELFAQGFFSPSMDASQARRVVNSDLGKRLSRLNQFNVLNNARTFLNELETGLIAAGLFDKVNSQLSKHRCPTATEQAYLDKIQAEISPGPASSL